jgi:hypothetical protein
MGKQIKWCSNECKQKSVNNKYQNYKSQQKRGRERKIEIVNIKGGSCEICGYNKSLAALSFHHLDPSTKKFGLDLRNLSNRKWDDILNELKKCQLLCMNCHIEIHQVFHFVNKNLVLLAIFLSIKVIDEGFHFGGDDFVLHESNLADCAKNTSVFFKYLYGAIAGQKAFGGTSL